MKQIVVNNVIRPTRRGTETLSFSFNMGPIKVICVSNIPEEGADSAPTYIKFQLPDENGEYPRKEQRHHTNDGVDDDTNADPEVSDER